MINKQTLNVVNVPLQAQQIHHISDKDTGNNIDKDSPCKTKNKPEQSLLSLPHFNIFKNMNKILNVNERNLLKNGLLKIKCKYYDNIASELLKDKVNILHINIRSLKNKIDSLKYLLATTTETIHIIALSETWLSQTDLIGTVSLPNYKFVFTNATNKSGIGGVGMYILETLNYKLLPHLTISNDELECVSVEISNALNTNKKLNVTCIYRHPSSDKRKFLNEIERIFQENTVSPHVITGDINLNLYKCTEENYTRDYVTGFLSYGFTPAVNLPTRVTDNSYSLIDHFLMKNIDSEINTQIITSDISDHFPILASFNCKLSTNRNSENNIYRRELSNLDFNRLLEDLRNITINETNNVNEQYESFNLQLTEILDKHTPIKKIGKRKQKLLDKQYLSIGILNSIKKKHKLFYLYRKTKKLEDYNQYKSYKNVLNKLLHKAKEHHYKKMFDKPLNMKSTWSNIKKLLNNNNKQHKISSIKSETGLVLENDSDISNAFNQFFCTIANKIGEDIPNQSDKHKSYLKNPNVRSIFLYQCNIEEIKKIIKSLDSQKSVQVNDIPISLLKRICISVSPILCNLINNCLKNGTFPDKLKTAIVTPIYKDGDCKLLTNYRPISLLPVISKIYEKVIHKRIYKFLEKFNRLNEKQFGFRQNRNTELCTLSLLQDLTKSLDEKIFLCCFP